MTSTWGGSALPVASLVLALAAGCGEQHRTELAAAARVDQTPAYLALGDSVAYGLDPRLVPAVRFSCYSCASFTGANAPRSGDVFRGYPEHLQPRLGIPLVNAACPGETTASLDARIRTGQAAICAEFKSESWLHVGYDATQRRYALDFLARRPNVQLVTVQIGANDVLDLVAACGGDATCVGEGIGGVLLAVHGNVSSLLAAIRSAGYSGAIVMPGYYAPSPEWAGLVGALNQHLALAASGARAIPVDLQALFGTDPCGAGLLIPLDPLDPGAGCDMHPTQAGAELIASAIASAVGR